MELHSSNIISFKTRELQSLLVLVLSLAIAFTASASSQGIDFSFRTFDNNNIRFQGDASISSDLIQLTKATMSKGWATYHKPMRLWDKATGNVADFTTNFTFIINSQGNSKFGDGFTFFLVPEGSQIPFDSLGRYLALLSPSRNSSISSTSFVAVEFDTYRNNFSGVVDSNCSQVAHVGIDLNNLTSAASSCVDWFKDKIMSGGRINATITYNSSTQNLSIVMIDVDATGTNMNSSAIYNIVNMTKYLPEWVSFGFWAATGSDYESHTLEAWEFRSNVLVAGKKRKLWLWATLGSGSFILLVLVLAFVWFRHCSKRKGTYKSGEEGALAIDEEFEQVPGPKKSSHKDLVVATNNFAIERLLGERGFGRVYEGYLTTMNAKVAIKKINPGSRQGIKEYATEVKTISQLQHRNLVQLIGWCHEKKELLIYEFMSNGIASALLYLHEEWEQCVLHHDIKSSNIMLDSNFNAKLGDFGLARLVDQAKGPMKAMGYMAPNCVYTDKASKESNVYSFGIVLLEIACGRKAVEPRADESQVLLVDWVRELYGIGRVLDAAESKLGTNFDEKQLECLMVVGLWCSHPNHTARPSIREALNVLDFNAPLPSLPSKLLVPTYLAPLSSFTMASIASSHIASTSGTEVSTFTTSSIQSPRSASTTLLPSTI
ncbi:hypothetical protein ACJRO7_017175 [Eucalyptus globulus]|uniref:non-specific serine/threonine protein kinase n=1 Tax=Eucalyptus globulus TaxID=34317 RepID=A0ABD3KVM4_EUCGL